MDTYKPYDPAILRHLIQSTLTPLGLYNENAEELLLATAAQESLFGTYRTQGNGGPARGIFQMEGATHDDIWNNYLKYHQTLGNEIKNLVVGFPSVDLCIHNDPYAIAMARVHYLRAPESLPDAKDLNALWTIYKLRYNTPGGAATKDQFYQHYKKYVTDGKANVQNS
jgi:hypothetical protein